MKSKLKIMHTESHRQWGGQERRVFSESVWMHRHRHRVIIVAPRQSPLYVEAVRQGWEAYAVSFTQLSMLRDFFFLRRLLRRIRPDVFNTHGNTDSKVGLFAAWGFKIPLIIRTRHSTPRVRNSWYNRLLYRHLCHRVFTTAACIKEQIQKDLHVPPGRIMTIPSGIDAPEKLMEHALARRKLADEIGVAPDRKFIGFVGRLSNEKGLDVLIDAFDAIKDRIADHHLVIVGDGDILPALRLRAAMRQIGDRVHLIGFRNDPWPYFRAFDCHVLASSRFEAVPQAVLQAMMAGCPVIGTQAGGIPDIIAHGDTGLLVPPEDVARLSEAVLETIEHPEAATARAAKAHLYVVQHHTVEIMGGQILKVYQTVLQDGPG